MNNIICSILQNIVISVLTVCIVTAPVMAQTQQSACQDTGFVIGFFNGVQNTPLQANVSSLELKRIHGSKTAQDEAIRYEVLYNYTNGFEDFVETFEQRLLEHDGLLEGRFELFFEAIRGEGPWWQRIVNVVSSTVDLFKSFVEWHKAKTINGLTSLFGNPPTEVNYVEHRVRIENWVLEGKKLLFVAHSQGNLFVNAAYDYALTQTSSESVSVVHVAPASPRLNGPHTLADLDLVINGLRLTGDVVSNTDNIPGYLLRPAGINGKKDLLGHGLIEIYINPNLAISSRVKSHINDALNTLVTPPAHASPGFFTATLTWNGTGDVDLHTYEPNGSHVYYSRPTGTTGYLDVDNTTANGPEHYFASCDVNKLQTGTYRVSVANYSRADSRTATVQVSSWKDGALGTKSVVLGEPTGSNPSVTMFNVNVDINQNTGSYEITVE
ncbi:YfaP family protein [Photobacterium alginatilyticum]|uniref:YfaP family protein n=1 Tax=Photobacterium alginatilyticum TaxID=1775171 RepID=UPI0040686C30